LLEGTPSDVLKQPEEVPKGLTGLEGKEVINVDKNID